MRDRHVPAPAPILVLALILALTAAVLAAVAAGPAAATPSRNSTCTSCHSGTASGTVSASPSTGTPAPGATYTVSVGIGLTASGSSGYHIAQTDAAGNATTWLAVYGGPGAQTTWSPTMTAPATPGTYYYKVWCAKGPNNSSGQAKSATYSITVPAPAATPAISSLVPSTGIAGSTFTITGSALGTSGTVTVGGLTAQTSAWSTTSITCAVPGASTTGAKSVIVTPSGAAASNALSYTVTSVPAPTPTPTPTPVITSLTPAHAQTGAGVVITGTNLGASGVVKFGGTTAATTAWSATSVNATVPAGLSPGATSVTVTPAGGSASNAATFAVDAPQAPADTTAPVTTASGIPLAAWCNHAVTVSLAAADEAGGSGVASITYAVDGGAGTKVKSSTVDVPLASSGEHTVTFFATDAAGNPESLKKVTVNIDTAKPQPRAPRAAKARHARTATLRYRIVDETPSAGSAKVRIVIRNHRGKIVKRLRLGSRPVNTTLKAKFRCSLRPGVYRFQVSAMDAAGNRQATVATQKLRVLAGRR